MVPHYGEPHKDYVLVIKTSGSGGRALKTQEIKETYKAPSKAYKRVPHASARNLSLLLL